MSKGYYRIDALRPDHKAGGVYHVRAASIPAAEKALRESRPLVADWELTTTRISREEYPMDETPEVLTLPAPEEALPDSHSEEREDDFNAWSAQRIRERLLEKRAAGEDPRLIVDDRGTRTVVVLGRYDEVSPVQGVEA